MIELHPNFIVDENNDKKSVVLSYVEWEKILSTLNKVDNTSNDNNTGTHDNTLPKDVEKHGDSLIKAWEQYIKIIDIIIALSGATALVMVNLLKNVQLSTFNTTSGMIAISSFGLSLFALAYWRFAAQHFFEYETIGGQKTANRYYEFHGITEPVTQAHLNQDDSRWFFKKRCFYRKAYKSLSILSGSLLAISWVSFFCLLFL